MFLEQHCQIEISPKDCVMHTCKSFIVLPIEPNLLPFEGIFHRFNDCKLIILLQEVSKGLMIVIVGCDMEYGCVFVIDNCVNIFNIGTK
jgi:hypothetical protein